MDKISSHSITVRNPIFSEQYCLAGYEIGLEYKKTQKWSTSIRGSTYCNGDYGIGLPYLFLSDHIICVDLTALLPGENKTQYRVVCSRETRAVLPHTSRRHFLSSCGKPTLHVAYAVLQYTGSGCDFTRTYLLNCWHDVPLTAFSYLYKFRII